MDKDYMSIARAVAYRYRGEQWWQHFDELVSVGLEAIARKRPEGGNLTYTICQRAVFDHFRHFGGRKETRSRPRFSYLTGHETIAYTDDELERVDRDCSNRATLRCLITEADLTRHQLMALAAYMRGDEGWARDLASVTGNTPDMARHHLRAARKKLRAIAYTGEQET